MSAEIKVAVIGAGVVGLAVAAEVARRHQGVFVFEKNRAIGMETSCRNSEVIHAGIHYPHYSLKAKLCVEGNALMYEFCRAHDIGHRQVGKIIVATDENDFPRLEQLQKQGTANGAGGLRLLSSTEVKRLEPRVECRGGLHSPSTGILDSAMLMRTIFRQAQSRGAQFVFNSEVVGLAQVAEGWEVRSADPGGTTTASAAVVVNAGGLKCDRIAGSAGIDVDRAKYRLHYCKGEYFSLGTRLRGLVNRPVYPAPEAAGLGIHVTPTLDGRLRLGPNSRYVDVPDYAVDEKQRVFFCEAVRKFLPSVELDDLEPESAGVRPKLQAPGEPFRDFVIKHEEQAGFAGLINLIGIESPGLTASLAIGRYVAKMVDDLL